MSIADALGRVQEIRSTLTTLNEPVPAPPTPAPTAATAANAATFAQALSSATGTAPITSPEALSQAMAAVTGSTPAPGPAAAATGPTTDTGKAVEDAMQKYLGLPYIWGGNDPAAGLDCSSFVQNVYKDLGYTLPRTTWDQVNQGTAVNSLAEAKPGDLLFTFDTGHVSIYLGNGKAVDAPQPGDTIKVRDMWETDANVNAIRRIVPDAAPVATGQAQFLAGAAA